MTIMFGKEWEYPKWGKNDWKVIHLEEVDEKSDGQTFFSVHSVGVGKDIKGVYMEKIPTSLCKNVEFC